MKRITYKIFLFVKIFSIKMTIPFVTEVPKWDVQLMLNKQIGSDFTIKSVNADFLMVNSFFYHYDFSREVKFLGLFVLSMGTWILIVPIA